MCKKTAIIVTLLLCVCVFASARSPHEFHHGFGGFSIDPKTVITDQVSLNYALEPYLMWGEELTWQGDDYRVSVAVNNAFRRGSMITENDKSVIISKWKSQVASEAMKRKLTLTERPYQFRTSRGVEITVSGDISALHRVFFIGTRMYVVSVTVDDASQLKSFAPILDSFRVLTETERTIAMIAQFSPRPLPQNKPASLPPPDTIEAGLKGNVNRVQDIFAKTGSTSKRGAHQTDFDSDGYKVREITFIEGFPDVITAWGWLGGKRINSQSAVNYPDREGPQSGRSTVVSGAFTRLPSLLPGKNSGAVFYGNRIETKFDPMGFATERRRYSGLDSLVLIEEHSRSGNVRQIKVRDSAGGFMSWNREKLDAHGNVIEAETLAESGAAFSSETYEYEFDSNMNWIVKKAYSRVKSRTGLTKKPIGVYYRTITYFDIRDRNVG